MTLQRAKSGFDISISTGLALEALVDATHPSVEGSNVKRYTGDYEELALNVATMTRNIIDSYSTFDKKELLLRSKDTEVLKILTSEIDAIEQIMDIAGKRISVFNTNFDTLSSYNTIERKGQVALSEAMMKRVSNSFGADYIEPNETSMVFSHIPIDWLPFDVTMVLESHTGNILTKETLNKKYFMHKEFDTSMLPFNEFLLRVFGDKNRFVKGMKNKEKVLALETLVRNRCTPYSTESWCETILKDVL